MKRLVFLFITIIAFCISSCKSEKSFEGVITYKVNVTFTNKNMPHQKYLTEKFGDTLKVLFDTQGNLFRKYIGTGPNGYDFHIYNVNTNNFYGKWKNLDTLYYYNAKKNVLAFIDREIGISDTIFNKPSKYILIKGYIPETGEKVTQKFYYTGFPYVNPKLLQNFKDFFTDEIFKTTKSPFLKYELLMDDCLVTYSVLSVERKKLNPTIFKIPDNIPLKKTD